VRKLILFLETLKNAKDIKVNSYLELEMTRVTANYGEIKKTKVTPPLKSDETLHNYILGNVLPINKILTIS
jgi:hypothetical protein